MRLDTPQNKQEEAKVDITHITPDQVVYWQWGFVSINATLVYTWAVMFLLTLGSWLITRRLSAEVRISRRQNLLEIVVGGIRDQIREVSGQNVEATLPFIGTLFIFIAVSNLLAVVPGFIPPTASLSTTTALALAVFVSVPFFGISSQGLGAYLKNYVQPSVFMLPFNVLGEFSRTLALAVRLFGNAMSGVKIGAVLLALVPLFFPVVMQILGLLTGMIQAYIFAILALVYIASATRAHHEKEETALEKGEKKDG